MTVPDSAPDSPKWGPTTKLIVGLTVMGIVVALMIQFRTIIGPLILAFVVAYLLSPVAFWLSEKTRLSWRAAVNLIYLFLLILIAGLSTVAGLAIFQQLQSLINFVEVFVKDLPNIVADVSSRVYTFGPFQFDFKQFDLPSLTSQLLGAVQPMVGRVGGLLSTFAASAASTIGWGLFILLISYFLLSEASQVSNALVSFDIPGYNADFRRLGQELRRTWNSFLRGQLIIFILIVMIYSALMSILGVRYALAIALMAGLGKFVPYIGPAITWLVLAAVSFFQGSNYFGLQPVQFALLAVILALVLDQVLDNLVTPRVMGQALGVHPAAVLVAAIIAANLIGLVGLVLAAPVVATLKLGLVYLLRKMFDLDPWPVGAQQPYRPIEMPWSRIWRRVQAWVRTLQTRKN
jgi:predicted PurR-regulated permease PerM